MKLKPKGKRDILDMSSFKKKKEFLTDYIRYEDYL